MSKHRESQVGAESLVDHVLSERRDRMPIRSDFADEIARNALASPRVGKRSRRGLPVVVIVVASALTASTAIAGIVHFIRQAEYRPAAPQGFSCVECEPLTAITTPESNSRATGRGTTPAVARSAAQRGSNTQAARLALTREIRIDGIAENLVAPRWILVGRDGRIVIDQQQDRNVRLFDASGRSIGRFGRRGEGPGEFENTFIGGWVGDSLWVHDLSQQRTTVITPDLAFARVIPDAGIKPPVGQETRFPSSASSDRRAIYEDGTSLVAVLNFSAIPAGFDANGGGYFRVAADGTIRNSVVYFNQPTGSVRIAMGDGGRMQGSSGMIQQHTPFYTRPLTKVSHRGNRIATLACIYDGPQARTMRVVMLGASGDTIYARNHPFTPQAIPRTVADSAHAAAVANTKAMSQFVGAADAAALTRAVQDQMRIPPFYPPFTSMVIADDGTAWIELRSPAGGATSFMLLDPRGSVVGTVAVPARTKVLTVSSTHMWGIELNQDDVPSVVRYRVAGR